MVDQQIDPSIEKFKNFINQYPRICEDIHSNNVSVQALYEKWMTVGEDDPYWLTYNQSSSSTHTNKKEDSNTSDVVQTIMSATKNMDMSKIQTYVEQVSSAVQSVQEVMQQFNNNKDSSSSSTERQHADQKFFQWMRD